MSTNQLPSRNNVTPRGESAQGSADGRIGVQTVQNDAVPNPSTAPGAEMPHTECDGDGSIPAPGGSLPCPPPDTGVGAIPELPQLLIPHAVLRMGSSRGGSDPIKDALVAVTDSAIDRNPAIDAVPFPLDVLPGDLADYVHAASASTGCEVPMIAVPMLAGFSGVIGNTYHVQAKSDWVSPCSLWTMVVAPSGAGKSPAFKAALFPIDELAAYFHAEYKANKAQYVADCKAHKALVAREKRRASRKGSDAHGQSLGAPPVIAPPVEPVERRLDFTDVTIEALAPLLAKNPRGEILKADELAVWINGFNQYKTRGKGTDSAKWNSIWDGQSLRIDRKTGDEREIYVPQPFLSVAGGIQTSILAKSVGPEQLDSGLLARILVTITVNPQKDCDWSEIDPYLVDALINTYSALSSLGSSLGDGHGTHVIAFDTQAAHVFAQWFREWRSQTRRILNEGLVAAMTKLTAYVPRLALVLHLVDAAQPRARTFRSGFGLGTMDPRAVPSTITDTTVIRAIRLVEWFAVEAKRLYSHLSTDTGDAEARTKILALLEAELASSAGLDGGWVSSRDLRRQRCGKNATHLAMLLDGLAQRGFLESNRSQVFLRKATQLSGARLCALLHNAEWMTKTPSALSCGRSLNSSNC